MSDTVVTEAPILTCEALGNLGGHELSWLWQDFLGRGYVSLFTSAEKYGKTTLLTVLLAKLQAGGELAGTAVSPGRALIISEESPGLWAQRQQRFNYGSHVEWICRPFAGRPSIDDWKRLIDRAAGVGADLVVIDPLMKLLPGEIENSAITLLSYLEPLHRLTDRGSAVMILHHPRKSGPATDYGSRGSGALCGFADILMCLRFPGRYSETERRRRLSVVSRFTSARSMMMALNNDCNDYSPPLDPEHDEFRHGWNVLRMVFEDASHRLTRQEVRSQWPADFDCPSPTTLWRWLDQATADNLVVRSGAGRRYDPFRYKLPGQIELYPELEPLEPLRMPMASATKGETFETKTSRRKKRRRERQRLRELAETVKRGMEAGGHITPEESKEIGRQLDKDLLSEPTIEVSTPSI